MEKTASKIADYFVKHKIIEAGDKELYKYGLWQGMFFLVNLLTTVVIGIVTGMLWQSLLFTVMYAILRSYTGGYHARTQRMCYSLSTGLIVISIGIVAWLYLRILTMSILILLAGVFIFILAPMGDINKPLTSKEKSLYRRKSRLIFFPCFLK